MILQALESISIDKPSLFAELTCYYFGTRLCIEHRLCSMLPLTSIEKENKQTEIHDQTATNHHMIATKA